MARRPARRVIFIVILASVATRAELFDWRLSPGFPPPPVRNIAVTAPYMHDGSIATLEEAIEHYAKGGRAAASPNKSTILRPFRLTAAEKAELIEFLRSLTDEEFLKDPRWSNPWR